MKRARLFLVGVVVALAACGGGGGGSAPAIAMPPPSKEPVQAPQATKACTVVAYGDSILAGNGDPETPLLTLQRLRPPLVIDNRAIPGTRLSQLELRFYNDPRSSRYVVIENGNIDSWSGDPVEEFTARLRRMVEFVRAEGRVPVLTGYSRIWPRGGGLTFAAMAGRDAYDAAAKQLAVDMGVEFADWGSAPFAGADDLLDEIHPAKAYSDRLVELLALALDRAAPGCHS